MNVIDFVLNKFGKRKYFHSVVSGECTTNGKPEPDIYLEASRQLDTEPENCIAVEDSINGVISAKNAGMYCIAVPDPRLDIEKYSGADLIVSRISDLRLDDII